MRLALGPVGSLFASAAAVAAPAPPAGLVEPPANAVHYIIESTGGRHGESWMWTTADGVRMGRERMNLRGQVWDLESAAVAGADGLPTRVAIRGVTPKAMRPRASASRAARRPGPAPWTRARAQKPPVGSTPPSAALPISAPGSWSAYWPRRASG